MVRDRYTLGLLYRVLAATLGAYQLMQCTLQTQKSGDLRWRELCQPPALHQNRMQRVNTRDSAAAAIGRILYIGRVNAARQSVDCRDAHNSTFRAPSSGATGGHHWPSCSTCSRQQHRQSAMVTAYNVCEHCKWQS